MKKFEIPTFTIFFLVGIFAFSIAIMPSVPTADASHYCSDPRVGIGLYYTSNLQFNKQSYTTSDSPNISGKVNDCNIDQVTVVVADSCGNTVAVETITVPRNKGDYSDFFWVQFPASNWYFSGTYGALAMVDGNPISVATMSFTGPGPYVSSPSDSQCSQQDEPSPEVIPEESSPSISSPSISSPSISSSSSSLIYKIKVDVFPEPISLCPGEQKKLSIKVTTLDGDPSSLVIKNNRPSGAPSIMTSILMWKQPSIGSETISSLISASSKQPLGSWPITYTVSPASGSSSFSLTVNSDTVRVNVISCGDTMTLDKLREALSSDPTIKTESKTPEMKYFNRPTMELFPDESKTLAWTSGGTTPYDNVAYHWSVTGTAAKWVSPQSTFTPYLSRGDTVPANPMKISIPLNASPGQYYVDYLLQTKTSNTIISQITNRIPIDVLLSQIQSKEPIIKEQVSTTNSFMLKGDLSTVTFTSDDFIGNYQFSGMDHPNGIEFKDGMSISTGTKLVKLEGETNMIEISPNTKIEQNEKGTLDLLWGAIKVHGAMLNRCFTEEGELLYSEEIGVYCKYRTAPVHLSFAPKGTEFILAYDPYPKLTEIIVNEGSVEIINNENSERITLDAGLKAIIDYEGNISIDISKSRLWDQKNEEFGFVPSVSAQPSSSPSSGGGCLIATATYGSELAPQVQQLRELRDNQLLNTKSGTSFMNTFNDFYYSFSPYIADYERENPVFKEMVKIVITPMISSLSILNYVDMDSEAEVLGYGISLILLNVGMYIGIPAIAIVGIRKRF